MFFAGMAVTAFMMALEEKKQFDAMCETLSPEDKAMAIAARIRRQQIEQQHARNMEVAREGRSLNFWGNR
jgi:hypothetical protein